MLFAFSHSILSMGMGAEVTGEGVGKGEGMGLVPENGGFLGSECTIWGF